MFCVDLYRRHAADDVNLWANNMDTVKKNAGNLIDASKAAGLEINAERMKYLLLSCRSNEGKNYGTKTANKSLKMRHS
jgi:hypothetical protein